MCGVVYGSTRLGSEETLKRCGEEESERSENGDVIRDGNGNGYGVVWNRQKAPETTTYFLGKIKAGADRGTSREGGVWQEPIKLVYIDWLFF